MIDFGLNDINIDFGLEETKPKKSNKPVDPKDPFGMNDVADGIKNDVQNTVNGIKSDIELVKKDYLAIKGEIMPIVDYVKNYKQDKKNKREMNNILAFCSTVKAKRVIKEEKETPKSLKERYPLMTDTTKKNP